MSPCGLAIGRDIMRKPVRCECVKSKKENFSTNHCEKQRKTVHIPLTKMQDRREVPRKYELTTQPGAETEQSDT